MRRGRAAASTRRVARALAIEFARGEPPDGPRCFIHRDFHPENTLWSRGNLTGIVD